MVSTSASQDSTKEAFFLFDKKGRGLISADQLGDLLRALGQNPTQAEVGQLTSRVGSDVDYNTFVQILNRPGGWEPAGTLAEFTKAFKVFDKEDSGRIAVGEVKYILTQLGEKMEESEVEELLKMASVTPDGQVNYEAFIKTVLAA
ncbi:myosin regulatory light chain cdc4 [Phaffia rhodozyma]|uniref:Myosin regulatory light chain cdc4 n=1 Tax=Phaffia rhodozyma TaxID=264483 RepID=A0A0F7SI73_PHARH|nr:myosin regulatory light chain cdc4 [Phaffia rhodozyma]